MQSQAAIVDMDERLVPVSNWLVVIGSGPGGPQALGDILPSLPSNLPATVVVMQDYRQGFHRVLVDQLNQTCQMPIHEAVDGIRLAPSRTMIAHATARITFVPMQGFALPVHQILVEDSANDGGSQYSRIDHTMISGVSIFGRRTLGVLLTGIGNDGVEGLRAIKDAGGVTIVQDEQTSVVCDLPMAAAEAGVAQQVVPLWDIAVRIREAVLGV
jgi:two-component system, chemotaxis family, protein-glutamate methylesterase/glutaminase